MKIVPTLRHHPQHLRISKLTEADGARGGGPHPHDPPAVLKPRVRVYDGVIEAHHGVVVVVSVVGVLGDEDDTWQDNAVGGGRRREGWLAAAGAEVGGEGEGGGEDEEGDGEGDGVAEADVDGERHLRREKEERESIGECPFWKKKGNWVGFSAAALNSGWGFSFLLFLFGLFFLLSFDILVCFSLSHL